METIYLATIVKYISFLVFLLNATTGLCQHTDLKEYGLAGKVRTMTVTSYRSGVAKKDSNWVITDPSRFVSRQVYYFNEKGFTDSVFMLYVSYDTANTPNYWNESSIWEFNKAGQKTGYKHFDYKRELHEEAELKWIDPTHYIQSNYNYFNGKKVKTSEQVFTLSENFRESSVQYKRFTSYGGVSSDKTTTNTLDANGHLTKKHTKDKVDGFNNEIIYYRQQKLDKRKNPVETVILDTMMGLVRFQSIRYSYYD
jgi:hypothetical protein